MRVYNGDTKVGAPMGGRALYRLVRESCNMEGEADFHNGVGIMDTRVGKHRSNSMSRGLFLYASGEVTCSRV